VKIGNVQSVKLFVKYSFLRSKYLDLLLSTLYIRVLPSYVQKINWLI